MAPMLQRIGNTRGANNCVDGCMPSDLVVGSTPEIEEQTE
jgi:hypothetical protein